MKFILLIAGVLLLACGSVFAQSGTEDAESEELKKRFLYEWRDDSGMIHITDALGKVPEQYRPQMRTVEVPKEEPAGQDRPVQTWSPSIGVDTRNEAAAKAQWKSRLQDWKQRRERAEERLQDLERERNELFRAWGSAALAPIENRLKAEKIDQQIQEARREIEQARNMLEEVIPEEARKAGVPPGWLRE